MHAPIVTDLPCRVSALTHLQAAVHTNTRVPELQVLILGAGPNRIGQGIEFDYCCCHASFSLRYCLSYPPSHACTHTH